MSARANDTGARRTRTVVGARLGAGRKVSDCAAARRNLILRLDGAISAQRSLLARRTHVLGRISDAVAALAGEKAPAAPALDASAMNDALIALTDAASAIDAWLDAAGPLRQQLDDAISAQQILLAADAQAAQQAVESDPGTPGEDAEGKEERVHNMDELAAALREWLKMNGTRAG